MQIILVWSVWVCGGMQEWSSYSHDCKAQDLTSYNSRALHCREVETVRPWRRQETGETLGWEKTGDRRQVSLSVRPGTEQLETDEVETGALRLVGRRESEEDERVRNGKL